MLLVSKFAKARVDAIDRRISIGRTLNYGLAGANGAACAIGQLQLNDVRVDGLELFQRQCTRLEDKCFHAERPFIGN